MATKEELTALKLNWMGDPCWDIEDTEGFEEHRDELLEFSAKKYEEWGVAENIRIAEVAEKMGIPGNIAVAYLIEQLQQRVTSLEDKVCLIRDSAFYRD